MTEEAFKDICLCGETTTVQFKEIFTSQKDIAKEMVAFANTKGGMILMIYRGLGSGIVRVMREDSHIDFDNEESANQFKVTVWRTIQKSVPTIQKNGLTIQKEGLKDNDTTQKKESTTQKDGLMDSDTIQKSKSTIQKDESTIQKGLDTTQKRVLEYFSAHPHSTIDEAVAAIDNLSLGGIKFIIGKLQQKGLLKRVGGRKQGEWKVLV